MTKQETRYTRHVRIALDAGHDITEITIKFSNVTRDEAKLAAAKAMTQLGFKPSDYQAHVIV